MGFEVFTGGGGGSNTPPSSSDGGFAVFAQPQKTKKNTPGVEPPKLYSSSGGMGALRENDVIAPPTGMGALRQTEANTPKPVDRTGLANFIAEKQAEAQGPSILDRLGNAVNQTAVAKKLAEMAKPYQLDPNNPEDLAELQRREGNLAMQPGEVPAPTLSNFKRRMDRVMRDTALPNAPVSYMPSTGNKAADFAASMLGTGFGFLVPGGAGAGSLKVAGAVSNTPRLLSEGNNLARLAKRGAVAGGTYGAAQGFGEDMTPSDTALNMLENAALFGALDAGLPVLGKAIKSFRNTETPLIKGLDLTRRGAPEVAPTGNRPPAPFNTAVPGYEINNARAFESGGGFSGRTDFAPPLINRSGGQVSTIPALGGRAIRSGAENLLGPPPTVLPSPAGRMVNGKFIPFAKAEGKGDFTTGRDPFSNNKPILAPRLPEAANQAEVLRPLKPGIPKKGSNIPGANEKVRSFPTSVLKSAMAKEETKAGLLSGISKGGPGTYKPVKLREVDAEATAIVNKDTESAVRFVLEGNEPSALHTATGIRLIERFQKENNFDRAIDVAEVLAEKLTKQGQAISAARIVGSLSPDGILRFAAREINKINNAPRLKIPGLTKDIKLTPDAAQDLKRLAEIMQSATGDAKIEAAQELQAALSALKPASIGQKLATTQTIGQLYNLKTQARNILGNELFYRLERLNKYVATPIDWTLTKLTGKERTVTFATAGQGGYWQGLLKGMKAGWKGVNVRGLQTQFDLGRTPSFKAGPGHNPAERVMSFLERSLGAVMKGFDHAAYNRAYNQTLGELATLKALNTTGKADKATVQRIMAEMDTNLMDIADQYGKYVTFQDENLISRGLQTIKRGLNVGQDFGIGDLVLKYPRTPGALLARALEYSPAGIFRAGWQIAKPLLNKQQDNREALLALSRAITGTTGLTGIGYYLADVGIITGKGSDDPDVRELEKQTGKGPYRVNMSALTRWAKSGFNRKAAEIKPGDTLITYDWAQPIAIALAAGANINESLKNNKEPLSGLGQTIYEGIESGTETIAEQPVLQGVKRLLTSYPGEEMGVMRKLGETLSDGLSSFVPTVSNQVRTSLDNTGRLTYDPSLLQRGINKAVMKVPGLAGKLPPAFTTLGQKKEMYQDGSNTGFNVFVNPAFVSQYKPSPEAQKVIDVYKNTGETTQVPRVVPKKITVSGQDFTLSGPEYAEYQRLVGEYTRQGFAQMSEITDHQAAAKYMQSIITDANTHAKAEILKARGEKVYKKGSGLAIWKE